MAWRWEALFLDHAPTRVFPRDYGQFNELREWAPDWRPTREEGPYNQPEKTFDLLETDEEFRIEYETNAPYYWLETQASFEARQEKLKCERRGWCGLAGEAGYPTESIE
jgi:hypothetical protein